MSLIFRRHANIGYLLSNIFVGILCSVILSKNFDFNRLISNEILLQTQVYTKKKSFVFNFLNIFFSR